MEAHDVLGRGPEAVELLQAMHEEKMQLAYASAGPLAIHACRYGPRDACRAFMLFDSFPAETHEQRATPQFI